MNPSLRVWLVLGLAFLPVGVAADKATSKAPLKCPPDWKVEIVGQAPQILNPSVVCTAPDGRVFVAQDPMDMGLNGKGPGDSILCLHPGGKVTLFAEKLYAVFGLAYLDGKLYVHHYPKLTVFTDDNGVGKDPVHLFDTYPKPRGTFNDHIPANIRLAMDGYFYMAVGDKGVYGAVGKDGSKVNLEGGGIVRFRPDGTQLEIYCGGTRNHLDAAMNAEDEMFTYDNTDDGNGWWTRVTHMVEGGFYGYPFDYKPRRPYALWMMADYGSGSPTGAIAYNEDALPPEYHGNLFMLEWGRHQVARFRVSREGATYQINAREEFLFTDKDDKTLSSRDKDFRPVGIALAPDGLSVYVTDWNFSGWMRQGEVGRLFKVTYTGKSRATPKPAWWLPAAMGKPFQASTGELLAGLKHPARSVRMVAQRRLAERGGESARALTSLLMDPESPALARVHALWALDAVDEGAQARKQILTAARDKEVVVRAQVLRQLGTRRVKVATTVLAEALKDADPRIRFRAATALGRVGDPATVPALFAALEEQDFFTRYAVFTALNRIGRANPAAWSAVAAGLTSTNPSVRDGTLFAMRDTYDEENVKALSRFVASASNPAETRVAALEVLSELHRKRPPWEGTWWGTQPVKAGPPARTVEWSGTALVLQAVSGALQDANGAVRLAAVEAAQTSLHKEAAPRLRELFQKESQAEMRKTALRALGTLRDTAADSLIVEVLRSSAPDAVLLPEALVAAGRIGGKELTASLVRFVTTDPNPDNLALAVEALGNTRSQLAAPPLVKLLSHPDAKVRSLAGNSLGQIGGKAVHEAVFPLLDDPNVATRQAAITTIGLVRNQQALPKLLAAATDPKTHAEAILALTKYTDLRALDAYLAGLADPKQTVWTESKNAIKRLEAKALPLIEERHKTAPFSSQVLARLQSIYDRNEQARQGILFNSSVQVLRPEDYDKFARKTHGDAARGLKIFADVQHHACLKCHRVRGLGEDLAKGGDFGPELTGIGTRYQRPFLVESVLYPSKQILDGYRQTVLVTESGIVYTGIVKGETSNDVTLVDPEGQKHILKKEDIESQQATNQSPMPEGLQVGMSLDDFADLIAFLESLHEVPANATKK